MGAHRGNGERPMVERDAGSVLPEGCAVTKSARNWAWDAYGFRDHEGHVVPLKGGDKLVLLCLAEHENYAEGIAYPGVDRIAARTGLSRRAVITHLVTLRRAGLITAYQGDRSRGRFRQNEYELHVPDEYRQADDKWIEARTDERR